MNGIESEAMAEKEAVDLKEWKRIALRAARQQPLPSCPERTLVPVVKLGEKKTHAPWENTTCPAVVVKVQDLINISGRTMRPVVNRIRTAGDIHKFLGFNGNVILSSITRDKILLGLEPQTYADLINTIKPDYYLTPDGETYFGREHTSEFEINRTLADTAFLLHECPNSTPIGLVKGCNLAQVETHTDRLLGLGVDMLAFHAGDYLCRGTYMEVSRAHAFISAIRKRSSWLMIYGCGKRDFTRFHSANCFVTQSHFIGAFRGLRLVDGKWSPFDGKVSRQIIMQNLRELEEALFALDTQRGLKPWIEENAEQTLTVNGKVQSESGLHRRQT